MTEKAKAIKILYSMNRITLKGMQQAVLTNIITKEEFKLITGENFEE